MVTVKDNMKPFRRRQITQAEKAQGLYAGLGYPSIKDYKWILKSNQIHDCPMLYEDAVAAEKIWGLNITALKGKTPWKAPHSIASDIMEIPQEI